LILIFTASVLVAQVTSDVLGVHDLSRGSSSPTTGGLSGSCYYCHAPHSGIGGLTPLWNQKLSTQVYTTYTSTTDPDTGVPQPAPGSSSLLCLSCHDGSVAPGTTAVYGKVAMTGSMKPADNFGSNLQNSHPTSLALPMKDSPDLAASLVSSGKTMDPTGKVHLVKGNIECTSCHVAHVQSIDTVSQNFLIRDSSSGQLCLACHDPNRTISGQPSKLALWSTSAHALASNTVGNAMSTPVGPYHTVGQNACTSCHMVHNSPSSARLLRAVSEQDCLLCHGGGSTISPAVPNLAAEFSKPGHPFTSGTNQHDAGESVLLNQNRHSTCVDCHNAHSSAQVQTFTSAPLLRPSQNNITGISAADGVSVVAPSAVNQYENCLRCHGTSIGKAINPIYGYLPLWVVSNGDPLNVIPQLAASASSSHPVTHDLNSALPQPSLRPYMINLDGVSQGRAMGVRIFCTDCHNADDNREFGGAGPNGPHGSKWSHILERRYEFTQAPGPGASVTNLFPNPDLSVTGPYALCAKCHDLNQLMSNSSFSEHSRHLNDGFSCSACHTSHGMGSSSGYVSGERLVNFDANVVAPNGTTPITYSRAGNSCTLTCHTYAHAGASASTSSNLRHRFGSRK
jgi:predicted CXXCH cytochrome family protein